MKLISEHIDEIEYITEAKEGGKDYKIRGVFLQAEVKNRNGRVYPMPVLQREVTNYNENFVKVSTKDCNFFQYILNLFVHL